LADQQGQGVQPSVVAATLVLFDDSTAGTVVVRVTAAGTSGPLWIWCMSRRSSRSGYDGRKLLTVWVMAVVLLFSLVALTQDRDSTNGASAAPDITLASFDGRTANALTPPRLEHG